MVQSEVRVVLLLVLVMRVRMWVISGRTSSVALQVAVIVQGELIRPGVVQVREATTVVPVVDSRPACTLIVHHDDSQIPSDLARACLLMGAVVGDGGVE